LPICFFAEQIGFSASRITKAYDTHLVYGLLQARALIQAVRPDRLEHEVDQLVQFRIRRRDVLIRTDPPTLTPWPVMNETVLRRQVGDRETMHAQLQRKNPAGRPGRGSGCH
jgi:hypothetical protein